VNRLSGASYAFEVAASGAVQINAAVYLDGIIPAARYENDNTEAANRALREFLRITEIAPWQDRGYVELTNFADIPLNLRHVRFLDGIAFDFTAAATSVILPGEQLLLVEDAEEFANRHDLSRMIVAGEYLGNLRGGGESIELAAPINDTIVQFEFDGSDWFPLLDDENPERTFSLTPVNPRDSAELSHRTAWRLSLRAGGSPGYLDEAPAGWNAVVINEVIAAGSNDTVELYNRGDVTVDLSGWWLSDDQHYLRGWQIPAGTLIPAQGFAVFDQANGLRFGISSRGETLHLTAADDGGLLGYGDSVRLGCSEFLNQSHGRVTADEAWARGSDGLVSLQRLSEPTLNAPNDHAVDAPVVITEWMDQPAFGQFPFVEFENTSNRDVGVYLRFATRAYSVDRLPAHQIMLLTPATEAEFRRVYSVPVGVTFVQIDVPITELIDVWSRVEGATCSVNESLFTDDDSWWAEAVGGASWERVGPDYGWAQNPANWRLTDKLGGTPGVSPRIPGDVNGDGQFNSSDLVLLFQIGEYEDSIARNSIYSEGDWNGDGDFDTADLVLAFQLGFGPYDE
ncbi:MAG: lamin tail domain-containing protein, partial [Planctomycetales bacterium]|nr:lamin tail domain-containing protein [Planctomycetales bacterium]